MLVFTVTYVVVIGVVVVDLSCDGVVISTIYLFIADFHVLLLFTNALATE